MLSGCLVLFGTSLQLNAHVIIPRPRKKSRRTDVTAPLARVRFYPESGHPVHSNQCQLCANKRHSRAIQGLQRCVHRPKAKRPRRAV